MMQPRCICIGASAGGVEPLRELVSQLPENFPVPVFVVMHIPPYQPSYLPDIVSRAGHLPALHPEDNTRIEAGRTYVAPPDHHMLIDGALIAVKKGPKENGFRPSIDALFRSAAYSYGPGVIGVVLSGALNDGSSGLWSIKRLGGTAIVQEPNGALYPSMPRRALEYVRADYQTSPPEIGGLLRRLADEQPDPSDDPDPSAEHDASRMALETQIAAGVTLPETAILDLGDLSPFTCPACHGTLVKIKEGNWLRFRCHTGHGYTADALLDGLVQSTKDLVWQSTRSYQEVAMLLEHLAQHLKDNGQEETANAFMQKSHDMNRQAGELRKIALDQESLNADKLKGESPQHPEDTAPGSQH